MVYFQAHFIIQAQKMGISSNAIYFYCYGFKVQKKAGFDMATLPCETFFSADQFISSILSNRAFFHRENPISRNMATHVFCRCFPFTWQRP
jgi:hypothetical protein